jgi:hypothetical protein
LISSVPENFGLGCADDRFAAPAQGAACFDVGSRSALIMKLE